MNGMSTGALVLFAGSALLFASCGWLPGDASNEPEAIAARAFDRVFTLLEVGARIPDELAPADSAEMAARVIDGWLREQVLVQQARTALPLEEQDFADELATYERALLTHAYEDRYVAQRLNGEVTEQEARAFYEQAPELFALNDFVVRATFVHLPASGMTDNTRNYLTTNMMSSDTTDIGALEVWCIENAAVHSVTPDTWWRLDDLLREVPLQLYRPERQLADRRLITFEQEGRAYFLRFWDHATAGEPAPFEAVQDQINELILHTRRENLLTQLQEELLRKAWENGSLATRKAEAGSESLAAEGN
jgi:hypothetical protein